MALVRFRGRPQAGASWCRVAEGRLGIRHVIRSPAIRDFIGRRYSAGLPAIGRIGGLGGAGETIGQEQISRACSPEVAGHRTAKTVCPRDAEECLAKRSAREESFERVEMNENHKPIACVFRLWPIFRYVGTANRIETAARTDRNVGRCELDCENTKQRSATIRPNAYRNTIDIRCLASCVRLIEGDDSNKRC